MKPGKTKRWHYLGPIIGFGLASIFLFIAMLSKSVDCFEDLKCSFPNQHRIGSTTLQGPSALSFGILFLVMGCFLSVILGLRSISMYKKMINFKRNPKH